MKKVYVLDTSVLIHCPESLLSFGDNHVVLPIGVIDELDSLQQSPEERGHAAKRAVHLLDELREIGDLSQGVAIDGSGTIQVVYGVNETCVRTLEDNLLDPATVDHQIIQAAMTLAEKQRQNGGEPVILVSKDKALRIKAESFGVKAQDYRNDQSVGHATYGSILLDDDYSNGIHSVRYRCVRQGFERIVGKDTRTMVSGGERAGVIKLRNAEQYCAFDALMQPDIDVVALAGTAGAGKTLLALLAGIEALDRYPGRYERIVVTRPIIPVGKDLGFLPGDIDEKMAPWQKAVLDVLDVVLGRKSGGSKKGKNGKRDGAGFKFSASEAFRNGLIVMEPLSYLRGRSLHRSWCIVDEAQNTTRHEIRTILTRAGEGSKVVVVGDTSQIDAQYLDSRSNGLSALVQAYINEENFCYIKMKQSVRSNVAEQAAALL